MGTPFGYVEQYVWLPLFFPPNLCSLPKKFKFVTEKVLCNDAKAQRELDYQHSTLEKMLSDAYGWLYAEGLL